MREYAIVLPIDEIPLGAQYSATNPIPLHCTLMHWFYDPAFGRGKLDKFLIQLAAGMGPFKLESEFPALFGLLEDTPVHVLKHNEILNLLHTRLFKFLARKGCNFYALQWVGAGFRPHVTTVHGKEFPPGSNYRVSRLVLLERNSDKTISVQALHDFSAFE